MTGVRLFAACLGIAIAGVGAAAQSVPGDSAVTPSPAFGKPELRGFALTALLGGLAYTVDDVARRAVRGEGVQRNDGLNAIAGFGNAWGQPGVVALGATLWGGGLLVKRPTVAASGLRAIEAITVSGVVTKLLKGTFGRARPYVGDHRRTDWQFTRGFDAPDGTYEAMPSGHATAAFAFASAVTAEVAQRAPRHARWVGITTYSAATLTAYARMHDDRHWFSDVTVGAGIGTITGLAIVRWHATRPGNGIDRWLLAPVLTPAPFGAWNVGLSLQAPR